MLDVTQTAFRYIRKCIGIYGPNVLSGILTFVGSEETEPKAAFARPNIKTSP